MVNYEDGDKETMSYRQINQSKCPVLDKDTMRRITQLSTQLHQVNVVWEMKKQPKTTKFWAHFANAVYDDDTC